MLLRALLALSSAGAARGSKGRNNRIEDATLVSSKKFSFPQFSFLRFCRRDSPIRTRLTFALYWHLICLQFGTWPDDRCCQKAGRGILTSVKNIGERHSQ